MHHTINDRESGDPPERCALIAIADQIRVAADAWREGTTVTVDPVGLARALSRCLERLNTHATTLSKSDIGIGGGRRDGRLLVCQPNQEDRLL